MAVSERDRILKEVRAALEREPRINLHKFPVEMEFGEGVLTLEGEVEHIAAKKLSLELAIAVHGVTGIVDRLHVTPATSMGDGAILDAVRDALLQEPTLMNCSIRVIRKQGRCVARRPCDRTDAEAVGRGVGLVGPRES
jgi:osmotically-inducible protein OsmY